MTVTSHNLLIASKDERKAALGMHFVCLTKVTLKMSLKLLCYTITSVIM